MSLEFKLTNQNLINYARTEDAHEAFVNSVESGQTRLALEVLVDLINGIVSKLEELDTDVDSASVELPVEQIVEESKPKAKQVKADPATEKITESVA